MTTTTATASLTDAMHQIAQAMDNDIVSAAAVTFAHCGDNRMIGAIAEDVIGLSQWQLFLDAAHRDHDGAVIGRKAGVYVKVRLEGEAR